MTRDVLNTDLYEVNVALAYLGEGMTAPATFSLFVRGLPTDRGFLVAAGLERVIDYLEHFHVTDAHIAVLSATLRRPVRRSPQFGDGAHSSTTSDRRWRRHPDPRKAHEGHRLRVLAVDNERQQ